MLKLFPAKRPGREKLETLVTTAELASTAMMGWEAGLPGHGMEWPEVARDQTCYAFLGHSTNFFEQAPENESMQCTNGGMMPLKNEWKAIWNRICVDLKLNLQDLLTKKDRSVLGYLFSRLGYECGEILGQMHKLRVSWGTYQDEMCRRDFGEYHCNAHSNNVVILEESCAKERFLSYLDLDMAFDESSYVDTWGNGDGLSEDEFSRLLKREHLNFAEVLAGSDSSTGVPQAAAKTLDGMSPHVKALRTALYDTLQLGYMRGYTGDASFPVAEYDGDLHRASYDIIKLAIVTMGDYVV
eukprot:m.153470 g.153470  ORF g.153470 m.153470 type:complete len:298 (-) comp15067_c0_seq3:149-1042(-)